MPLPAKGTPSESRETYMSLVSGTSTIAKVTVKIDLLFLENLSEGAES